MRSNARLALAVSASLCLVPPVGLALCGPAFAQAPSAQDKSAAPADAQDGAPTQVALTQKDIDNLIAAQKAIRPIEAKMPQSDKGDVDPKTEAKIEEAIKANGFSDGKAYSNVSYSVGVVLAGMDPDGGDYIGAQAAIKKQLSEVQADKKMAPKEKKEAVDELNEALKAAPSDKPMAGNVDLVKKNVDKLNQGMQQPE